MGLVYIFLFAWIAGGVLLGSTMLLAPPQDLSEGEAKREGNARPTTLSALFCHVHFWHPASMGLIGFGLGGLAAEGMGQVTSFWTVFCACLGAACLWSAGYLTRSPKRV